MLHFRSYADIVSNPLPPVEYDVEPLIARGARVLIYAEPGVGKTWLALDLALSLAAGRKWIGQFAVPSSRSVLYLDEEMGQRPLERRIFRLGAGAEITDTVPFRALSHPGLMFTQANVSVLVSAFATERFDPQVVIVDSLRRVLVGSENEAEAVAAFWRTTTRLYKARTLIIIHHMKKPNPHGANDSRYRASGSTDLLAVPDVAFAITRAQGDAMLVECVKNRHGVEPEPFLVSLCDETDSGPIVLRYDGSPADARLEKAAESRAADLTVKFLSERSDRTASTGEIDTYLNSHGVKSRTAERARATLKKAGRLEWPEGKRGWWRAVK
jgi:AAA domain